MIPARVTEHRSGDRTYNKITINEVGTYALPARLLQSPIFPRALEVARLSLHAEDHYTIQPLGNTVTSEMLTKDLVLEILPKVSFEGFHLLLQWSNQQQLVLPEQSLPIEFREGIGLYEMFMERFLSSLQEVIRKGWLPDVVQDTLISDAVHGRVDPVRSVELMLSKMEVAFYQSVNRMTFDGDANRVLRTALLCIHQASGRVGAEVVHWARDILTSMPVHQAFADSGSASVACQKILSRRSLDTSRAYYYRALDAALPILQATSRDLRGRLDFEDVPLRISMPTVFESAVRNVTKAALGSTYVVTKGNGERSLYDSSQPSSFNPSLHPDIIIRPLGSLNSYSAVFDVKYKESPTDSDHYQISAYLSSFEVPIAGFVTIVDEEERAGPRREARTREGARIVEFGVFAGDLQRSLREYSTWMTAITRA